MAMKLKMMDYKGREMIEELTLRSRLITIQDYIEFFKKKFKYDFPVIIENHTKPGELLIVIPGLSTEAICMIKDELKLYALITIQITVTNRKHIIINDEKLRQPYQNLLKRLWNAIRNK